MSTYRVDFETSNKIAASNSKQRKGATKEIIEDRLPTCIDKHSRSRTLVNTHYVRLDLQGQFNHANGIRYANLQIQLNATTTADGLTDESEEEGEGVDCTDGGGGRNRSTTIAIVLMPCDEKIPEITMKQAFKGSLEGKKKATIFKND
jgi:hypothetical protein